MPLFFVSCRTLAGQTVWAGHFYATDARAAREIGAAMRRKDQHTAAALGYSAHFDSTPTEWHARRSTAYANAMNTEA